jgi:DNA ligase-1
MQAAPFLTRRAALVAAAAIVLPRRTAARRPPGGNAENGVLRPELATVYARGGEGRMLHLAHAAHVDGRSAALFKLKPHLAAEAVVVGYRAGAGKLDEFVGALEIESPQGRRFFIGSGLDDAARRDPPPIGATVTYRYRELTSNGLPRFATYLRQHHED